MNFTILRFETLDSTNTEAARQAKIGAAEGVCVVARQQTAGRGRRERIWHSPVDAGLYFSLILRPKFSPQKWALITLAAAVAVHEAILTSCNLETDIKWANDVHTNAGKKLCGILAETVETANGGAVVLGIGINLKAAAVAPELSETASSIENETGAAPNFDALLAALTASLRKYYLVLNEENGASEIIKAWQARSSYAFGKKIRVTLENEIFEGETCGLEASGALRVQAENGIIKTIYAGDVVALRLQK